PRDSEDRRKPVGSEEPRRPVGEAVCCADSVDHYEYEFWRCPAVRSMWPRLVHGSSLRQKRGPAPDVAARGGPPVLPATWREGRHARSLLQAPGYRQGDWLCANLRGQVQAEVDGCADAIHSGYGNE